MKKEITTEELRQMVVNSTRENGVSEFFKSEDIDEVVQTIISGLKLKKEKEGAPSGVIPESLGSGTFTSAETGPVSSFHGDMPKEDEILANQHADRIEHDVDMKVGKEAGANPTEQVEEPKMYKPELPHELRAKEPSELVVWDYNELSVGGENLSNKPFRKLENPDERLSMLEAWKEEGKSTAEVYVAKFEKVGEIVFDYVSGQSKFIENGKSQDVDTSVNTYHENPYNTQNSPQVDKIETETDLSKSLESSVDIQKTIEKVLHDIIARGLNQNGAEEEEASTNPPTDVTVNEDDYEIVGINEVTNPYGKFKRTETPPDLLNALNEEKEASEEGYEKKDLKEVTGYCKDNVCYYFPSEPVSFKNCYIKN